MYIIPLNILAQGGIHCIKLWLHVQLFFSGVCSRCFAGFDSIASRFMFLFFTFMSDGIHPQQSNNYFTFTSDLEMFFSGSSLPGNGPLQRIRSRGLRGPTQNFYLVVAFPLHRHLLQRILYFLTTDRFEFTVDVYQLAFCSTFLLHRTLKIRRVDTPSVESDGSLSDGQ